MVKFLLRWRALAVLAGVAVALLVLPAACGPIEQELEETARVPAVTTTPEPGDTDRMGPTTFPPPTVDLTGYVPVPHPRTPLPYETPWRSVVPLDISNAPTCQFPLDERPAPRLPPYSCRHEGNEPEPGAIPTPRPGDVRTPAAVPDGWRVIDNRFFRLSLALPEDWYSDMRPEGGEFHIFDPVSAVGHGEGIELPGGVSIHVTAREYDPVPTPSNFVPVVQEHLLTPNASVAGYPAAIWEDAPAEGLARIIQVAFVRNAILFQARIHVVDDGRPETAIQTDVGLARQIIDTLTSY